MAYFDFSKLIDKYSTDFIVILPTNGGYDDSGEWKEVRYMVKKHGAIISHRESKIFKSEGTLTEQDRALYMLEPLDKLPKGTFLFTDIEQVSSDSGFSQSEGDANGGYLGDFSGEEIIYPLEEAKVIHNNRVYSISSMLENAEFTGCYNYSLKFVSVFGGVDND